MTNKKIRVHNEAEFNAAVKYFTDQGFKPCDYQSMNYTNAIQSCRTPENLHVILDNLHLIGWESVEFGLKDMELITLNEGLKKGDIVNVWDSSWSVMICDCEKYPNKEIKHFHANYPVYSTWEVVEIGGPYPINIPNLLKTTEQELGSNNLMLRSKDKTYWLFTRTKFVHIVKQEPPITIQGNEVKFNSDGSIDVGCTHIDKSTLDKIAKNLKGD
jgi:hypothetical protein